MKTILTINGVIFLSLSITVLFCSSTTPAQTITFDDLTPSTLPGGEDPDEAPIPNNYAGLQWNNLHVLSVSLFLQEYPGSSASGYNNGLVSGDNVAFNNYGNPASISGGTFNFLSAYVTAAWYNQLQVEVQGFTGATLAYDTTFTVDTTGPSLINFNYFGVNEVKFISSGGVNAFLGGSGTHLAIDNIIIQAVPEPTTLALGGLGGLAALVAFRRRK